MLAVAVLPHMAVRILLVEDDAAIARIFVRALVAAGHAVDHSPDGAQGFTQMLAVPYDIVISDVGIPKLDGLDLLELARRLRPDVSVIMISGQLDPLAHAKAREMGAIRYLLKPISLLRLTRAVDTAAKLRAQRLGAMERRSAKQPKSGEFCFDAALDGGPAERVLSSKAG
jgi:DNA-binding response OmpR family regulator